MYRFFSLLSLTLIMGHESYVQAGYTDNQQVQPSGFTINLPPGWIVQNYQQGYVRAQSADNRRFVLVRPILGRTSTCADSLRRAFAASWSVFPGARNVEVGMVQGARGLATARFTFADGRARGAVMCAETSSGTGMYYGVAAPVETFPQEVGGLVNILKTFRYGSSRPSPPAQGGGAVALPRMTSWREPRELAYTLQIPEGWRVSGGLVRHDVTHAKSGVDLASPDGQALLRIGDGRIPTCTVPGPGMASMGSSGGMNLCPYQTGRQAGEQYLYRTLAREWGIEGLQILSANERPDLNAEADRGPAQFGLKVRNAYAELRFRGTRRGTPVEGWMLANTQMMASVSGQNFLLGQLTMDFQGVAGPPARASELAGIAGHVVATVRWSPEWIQREQRISADLTRRVLDMMHAQAENQQKAFWARMEASDRRRDAVNDILGGTVRLSDGEGHQYEAKAGSNYYFRDEDAARRVGRPDDAVVGRDLYPSPLVDLRPLEVIR